MKETVFLDIDNTLLDFHACAQASLVPAFASVGLRFLPDYIPVFHEVNDALWRQIEDGKLTREGLYAVRFHRLFAALGLSGDGDRAETEFRRAIAVSAEPVEGAHALLRYLYPRYTLCAASNSLHLQQVKRLTRAGMLPYFTHLFTSEMLGVAKPDPAFFEAAFRILGNPPKESAILIGDSLTADIRGGAAYGIRTCWYNPRGMTEPLDRKPTYTVKTLAEIQEFL